MVDASLSAVLAYADAFDFKQGALPLSSWKAPAVRRIASHRCRRQHADGRKP